MLADAGARALVAVVLVALLVVGVVVVRRRSRRRSVPVVAGPAVRRGDPAVAALLLALERFDAAVPEPWRRGPAEGLSDWRARVGPALGAEAGAEVAGALAVVERACFARALPPRAELEGARRALESASSVLAGAGAARDGGSGGVRRVTWASGSSTGG